MWYSEMVTILRHMIDDTSSPLRYTDDRLMQLLLVGAQLTQTENNFAASYDIDIEGLNISPDPTITNTRDNAFINLTILKSACLLAGSGLGKNSTTTGMLVVEGPYRFDSRKTKNDTAEKQLQVKTWCQAYVDAKWENVSSQNAIPGEAVIGPYRNCAYRGPYSYREMR